MIKEAIGIGNTVEEAKENALAELNAGIEEDIQFEVLSTQKKKVLGIFGGSDARVRAFVELPDPKPEKKAQKAEKPQEKKADKKKAQKQPTETKEKAPEKTFVPEEGTPASAALNYTVEILKKLGCEDIEITVSEIEGGSKLTLKSEKIGIAIGRRGETLDALQYLASLVANEKCSGYYRIVLDTEDYREKREKTLTSLATRTANQVLRTGRNRALEPMNPYERRIIHTAIQNIDGVCSSSIGEGSGRRVVVCPEGKSPRPYNNGGKNRNQRRPSYKSEVSTETTQTEKKVDAENAPLYGRIG